MVLFAGEGTLVLFMFCFACLWAVLGSWLAIAPTATATFFGIKNSAANYGVIFSARTCLAAISMPFISRAGWHCSVSSSP
jgi:hypothetical protein